MKAITGELNESSAFTEQFDNLTIVTFVIEKFQRINRKTKRKTPRAKVKYLENCENMIFDLIPVGLAI